MTREEIEQALADLKVRKLAILSGKGRTSVTGADGGSVSFQMVSIADINQEIKRLEIDLAKLTGQSPAVRPVIGIIGGRT